MTRQSQSLYRRWLIPLVLLLAIAITVALVTSRPSAKTAMATEPARSVDTITASKGNYSPTIPLFVKVTTPYHSRLRASVTADVKTVLKLKGDRVNENDVLIVLDDREAQLVKQQRQADVSDVQSQID